ncbi:MAG TPA: site-specific integrase [Pyrinomonadaceae bacterium]|nr:site-specific integrase [Pyrinomonadaceae bacterium]
MPRIRKGAEIEKNGNWYGRVRYTLPNGKRKDIWMPAQDKTHAAQLVREKLRELELTGESEINSDRVTFAQLAQTYREKKLVPAKIIEGRKVAGVKSIKPALCALEALINGFGKQRIKTITHSDIETYKLKRLDTPSKRGGQRSIASVNRELEMLRAMFRFALRQGWLMRNPFSMGDSLISKADEVRRERILSPDEERRLLDACHKQDANNRERLIHLKPLIIAALDTGCRRGELFKLLWRDVNFGTRTITILAENCKTARPRIVGITPRLFDELKRIWEDSTGDKDALVFGVTNTIKTGWRALCLEAKIEGVRFHDLRHTAITRMVKTRQPASLIMKVSGHTQHSTFARYVNPDNEMITGIAEALAEFNAAQQSQSPVSEATELVN